MDAVGSHGYPSIVYGWVSGLFNSSAQKAHTVLSWLASQRVVLNLVARGQSNTEIAQALFIATKTVRNHVCAICGNLDLPTRAQLIVQAREKGFGAD
ncbi:MULTISPECIES: LuxR C-terminal-related transcriptional regulator [unclassified Marinobacter]|uniref:LuxR C-terminal-related transcriptional regulator n=1 Tax=unclassified Marinobacter TaxID=83889 RepID=UPI0032C45849